MKSMIGFGIQCNTEGLQIDEMVLVRTEGHRCQDHTENDLAKQLNSETVTK